MLNLEKLLSSRDKISYLVRRQKNSKFEERNSPLLSGSLLSAPYSLSSISIGGNKGVSLWTITVVLLALVVGCVSAKPLQAPIAKTTPSPVAASTSRINVAFLQNLQLQLYQQMQASIAQAQGARQDGYVYTIDFSQILVYAAGKKDRRLYTPLRDFAVRNLIIDERADPYTQGFVLWRYREGSAPDASGTTEALRLAQGLWLGSQVFGDNSDRQKAILILQGYARHAQIDHQVWLIRNYFNLQTRAFANNSFLLGYDPDFLREVAQATGDPDIQTLTQKSYTMVRQAVTPSGLLYDIIQPEVLTLVPELKNLVIFSPNDVVKLANTCTVAERAIVEAPEIGQRVIRFALERLPQLNSYYYGRTGESVIQQNAEVTTYACLVRLATKLQDQKALNAFLHPFRKHAEFVTRNKEKFSLYTVVETLLALQLVLEQNWTQQNKVEYLSFKVANLY